MKHISMEVVDIARCKKPFAMPALSPAALLTEENPVSVQGSVSDGVSLCRNKHSYKPHFNSGRQAKPFAAIPALSPVALLQPSTVLVGSVTDGVSLSKITFHETHFNGGS